MDGTPIIVYPPDQEGGRRVRARAGGQDQILGRAYSVRDVKEFLRRAGLDPDEVGLGGPLVEWRGGGPDVWGPKAG
ncbi:hypothetical protein [Streptomyces sp. NRRL F-5053]|uniref:hypothetical protein n=1 Tax=Streptomyces sp. NRRL F-5053 TaxID=1463854 RepID=UPI0004C5A6F3|nr:hypothetical protein [Streptomyces sp. NRRL F-5053]